MLAEKTIVIEGDKGFPVTEITAISVVEDGLLSDTRISVLPFHILGEGRDDFISKLESLINDYYI